MHDTYIHPNFKGIWNEPISSKFTSIVYSFSIIVDLRYKLLVALVGLKSTAIYNIIVKHYSFNIFVGWKARI